MAQHDTGPRRERAGRDEALAKKHDESQEGTVGKFVQGTRDQFVFLIIYDLIVLQT